MVFCAYEENRECDFSFSVHDLARFRVNTLVEQRGARQRESRRDHNYPQNLWIILWTSF